MALALGTRNTSRDWVKKMDRHYKVVPHLERAIESLGDFSWSASFDEKAKDDAWHPSGDCTPSLNELWLKAMGKVQQSPIDGTLRKIFTVGHFWHGYLQAVLVASGMAEPENIERRGMVGWGDPVERGFEHTGPIPWKPWHWVTGSIDAADVDIPVHGLAVVDFKTMNQMHFKLQDPPEVAGPKWECQLNIYMDWTDRETGFIVGIDKCGTKCEFKEFMYERNQPLIDALYAKWEILAECVEASIEPPEDEEYDLPLQGPIRT